MALSAVVRVAAVHAKDHGSQSIQGLFANEAAKDFAALNFQESRDYDSTGRKLPMKLMTKGGYAMLAMALPARGR